ncbi:LacI family transcriptional regulator [Herbiconiux sp. CPCC 205716]|uniref:LacI family transcriptional regulator n=1 Tax=Herbiconiux gentiana TaxID=2970912 RepID=A0ABT2GAE0_9MICO|nr:LacI family DNA-binding transcriptional regulator [Herbiconiux gentiana]MCS5713167.1 LacI family transcriptional regulator [Herbiconiux gentiana]
MPHNVTIEDIAAEAGVSRQTVSRAMNGMPRISEKTRARVLEVSERLGYRPSRFASNLARVAKAKTVGLVVDSLRNPYYSELAAELLDAASLNGWQLTISSHENEPVLPMVARLAGEVDAVVGYFGEDNEEELLAAARGVPVVLLGRTATVPGLHSVDIDFDSGFVALIDELRRRGAARFGMLESHIHGTEYAPSSRRLAYERSTEHPSSSAVIVCEAEMQSVDAGEAGMHALLDRYPDTDTVIAFSDLMAMGALRAAHSRGIDIPSRLKVVGIDGLSLGAVTSPALTSLAIVGSPIIEQVAEVVRAALQPGAVGEQHRRAIPAPLWRESA